MIRSTRQIMLMRLGRPVVPANFGGDSRADSSTHTTNDTDNWYQVTDKRNTVGDQAVGLSGDNNVVDRSTSSMQSWFDASNRSTTTVDASDRSTYFSDSSNRSTQFTSMSFDARDQSTHFSDASDRSTHFTDASDRSTYFSDSSKTDNSTHFSDTSNRSTTMNSNNVTSFVDNSDRSTSITDYGSVNGSLSLANALGVKAFDTAALGIGGAIDTLKLQSGISLEATKQAFDLVRTAGAQNQANSASVLGLAQSAIRDTAGAILDAKDQGESKTVMYALAAVAVIGVAFAMNR